jgi:excinuclease UvrABC nuclease subunit
MADRLSPYRDLGNPGENFPAWVRELRGKSGVYVIQDARAHAPLYVGESHTDRLYETLTRHVQRWNLPEAHSYPRESVTVAVRTVADKRDAPALQREYIAKYTPRDNVYETQTDLDEVPF